MVNCAILSCKNTTKTVGRQNGDISFHSFPKDPGVKEKWIDATGHTNWFPTKYSAICSIHFDQNSFTEAKKCRRLINTAYPTIDVLMSIKESTLDKGLTNNNNYPIKVNSNKDLNRPSPSDEEPKDISNNKNMQHKLNIAHEKIRQQNKQIKRMREQIRRRDQKILTLMAFLEMKNGELKIKHLVTKELNH